MMDDPELIDELEAMSVSQDITAMLASPGFKKTMSSAVLFDEALREPMLASHG